METSAPPARHPLLDQQEVRLAAELAQRLLTGDRLAHSRAVAERAAAAAHVVPSEHAPTLVAAAWLHDVGYAVPLRKTGFHPLDGARHLDREGWPRLVAGLVAHHSGARFVAAVHGLADELAVFDDREFTSGRVADALTWADQTVGPTGQVVDLPTRLADMLRRHGADSPNARCHAVRAPVLSGSVTRTEQRLVDAPPPGAEVDALR